MPYTYLMTTGGGVLHGDRQRTDLRFGPGTAAHVTTQAHTKLYRMDHGYAAATINLNVAADAYVEYLPDPVIPYAGARYSQRTHVTLDPTATFVLGETLYAGRLSRGERNEYDVFATDLEIVADTGRPLVVDRVRLGGTDHAPDGPPCSTNTTSCRRCTSSPGRCPPGSSPTRCTTLPRRRRRRHALRGQRAARRRRRVAAHGRRRHRDIAATRLAAWSAHAACSPVGRRRTFASAEIRISGALSGGERLSWTTSRPPPGRSRRGWQCRSTLSSPPPRSPSRSARVPPRRTRSSPASSVGWPTSCATSRSSRT